MKSRTNVSVDRILLEAARRNQRSLSRILENALRKRLAEIASSEWLADNGARIHAYGEYVAENGVFGESFRDF